MQKTKKSLIASGLAMIVCLAMLIGTTFAWFTDSVMNKGNHIQAGTLDVTFQQLNTETKEYEDITGPVFNYDKWEPGYTYVSAFKIGNNGSLALKYQLDFVLQGEVSKLAEVIDVYYTASNDAITELPDSVENMTKAGTLAQVLAQEDGVAHGHLSAGEADYAAVALHMQETAGNEYQDLSIGTEFDIVLKATQYTEETDGFGSNQYDAGAEYDVATQAEFEDALANAQDGDTITLASDFEVDVPVKADGNIYTIDKAIKIDGNGATMTVDGNKDDAKNTWIFFVNGAIDGTVEISNVNFKVGSAVKLNNTSGDVKISNCTFSGKRSVWVNPRATGETIIDGCTFTGFTASMNLEGSNADMPVQNVTISNNKFNFNDGALTMAGTISNVNIFGNTFTYPVRIDDSYAGYTHQFTNVRIHDNTFGASAKGLAYKAKSGTTYDGIIAENNVMK